MLFRWLGSILRRKRRIDVRDLPSQGFFYDRDFTLTIKAADEEEIRDYESDYDRENFSSVLSKLKRIVERNVILGGGYTFNHIKSIDIVFLFLEIVKLTRGKQIHINYYDDERGKEETIEFGKKSFNYFQPDGWLLERWDDERKCFEINGYCVSLPGIGIESSLTHYLIERSYGPGSERLNDYRYDFTFFVQGKERLNFEEIDNLIQIFNFDIDEEEKLKVEDAVERLKPMQRYSLVKDGRVIDMSSKINLEKIWK